MILRSEEVRSIIHQALDVAYDSGMLIMETGLGPKMERTFAVKLRWMGMKIPIAHLIESDNKKPS